MAIFLTEIFLIIGKGPTIYLYFRRTFKWDEKTFGPYVGFFGILALFAKFVVVPFMSQYFKLHDTTIGKFSM